MILSHHSMTHSVVTMLSVDSTCPHSTITDSDQLLHQQWLSPPMHQTMVSTLVMLSVMLPTLMPLTTMVLMIWDQSDHQKMMKSNPTLLSTNKAVPKSISVAPSLVQPTNNKTSKLSISKPTMVIFPKLKDASLDLPPTAMSTKVSTSLQLVLSMTGSPMVSGMSAKVKMIPVKSKLSDERTSSNKFTLNVPTDTHALTT